MICAECQHEFDGGKAGDEPECPVCGSSVAPAAVRDTSAKGSASTNVTVKRQKGDTPPSPSVSIRQRSVARSTDAPADADYKLLDLIGEGGMGLVYSARQTAIDRNVAIKMLKPDEARKAESHAEFVSEAIVTADLDHPHIVPVHDLGKATDGTPFYVMKHVIGQSWSKALSERTTDENIDVLLRVADAVAFAHSRGVIHRDIRPANVMLGDYGEVFVMDWGLAASVKAEARARRIAPDSGIEGTPAYMSPEMAAGDGTKIGVASDVYLLGAVLYEIVTGLRPHKGETVEDCIANAAANVIQPAPVKTEFVEIALKAMATDPKSRYAGVKEFQAAIRECRSHGESIAAEKSAAADLTKARETKDYRLFARATLGFEHALNLWPQNKTAKTALLDARLLHAGCAFERGDLDLAESLLDPDESQHSALLKAVRQARSDKQTMERAARRTRRTIAILASFVVCVLIAAAVWVRNERKEALAEQSRADNAVFNALREKLRREALDRQRREEWIPVCDLDFSAETAPDERFETVLSLGATLHTKDRTALPAPEGAEIRDGMLVLHGTTPKGGGLTVARWKEDVGEDIRLRLVVPGNACLGVAFCGDSLNGYRAIFDLRPDRIQHPVELDTIADIEQIVLARGQGKVDPFLPAHTINIEKVGPTIRLDVDGGCRLEYFDPCPFAGPSHRTFALSAYWGDSVYKRLAVWRRRSPEVVSVLEEGRGLLRRRSFAEAEAFFREQSRMHDGAIVGAEANFLLGVALQYEGKNDEAMRVLKQTLDAGAQAGEPVMGHLASAAAGQMASICATERDWNKAVSLALAARERDVSTPVVDRVFNMGLAFLRRQSGPDPRDISTRRTVSKLTEEDQAACLAALARLPVEEWDLSQLGLRSLHGLSGAAIKRLNCYKNPIRDLAVLGNMRPASLNCTDCGVADLSPLRGLPLTQLWCEGDDIRDIQPLKGMPLADLRCDANRIADLSPLTGMPLEYLSCARNAITDISPLRGMPLASLFCEGNCISDISALKGMQLTRLCCEDNNIGDIAPLAGLPLAELRCGRNNIAELTPLAGAPLRILHCEYNPIHDLSPLRGIPMKGLCVFGIPITDTNAEVIAGLPLEFLGLDLTDPAGVAAARRLRGLSNLNGCRAAYVFGMIDDLAKALNGGNADMRKYAGQVGDRLYLAIPQPMTWAAAEAFCRILNGRMVSPASLERFRDVLTYLRTIGAEGSDYHVGARFDRETGEFVWISGEVWSDDWFDPDTERRIARERGIAIIQDSEVKGGTGGLIGGSRSDARYPFVVEWGIEGR